VPWQGRWKHFSFSHAKYSEAVDYPCAENFQNLVISEIAFAGFSGIMQQTLVLRLPGLPNLFHCPHGYVDDQSYLVYFSVKKNVVMDAADIFLPLLMACQTLQLTTWNANNRSAFLVKVATSKPSYIAKQVVDYLQPTSNQPIEVGKLSLQLQTCMFFCLVFRVRLHQIK